MDILLLLTGLAVGIAIGMWLERRREREARERAEQASAERAERLVREATRTQIATLQQMMIRNVIAAVRVAFVNQFPVEEWRRVSITLDRMDNDAMHMAPREWINVWIDDPTEA